MAVRQYLDQEGLQRLWEKICWQDRDLLNKITINSNRIDEIVEHQGKVWIEYDTTARWEAQPELVSERGIIYVYSDGRTILGQIAPRVKIGDGNTLLKNLIFIDEDINEAIRNLNQRVDDKVGCRIDETTLQFYKD